MTDPQRSRTEACRHPSVSTFTAGDMSMWACDDCSLRFYPACRTCVDVGHRNVEHPAEASLAAPAGLRAIIEEGIEAFRLTREYVGEDTLPALPGWSWFDWTVKALEAAPRSPEPDLRPLDAPEACAPHVHVAGRPPHDLDRCEECGHDLRELCHARWVRALEAAPRSPEPPPGMWYPCDCGKCPPMPASPATPEAGIDLDVEPVLSAADALSKAIRAWVLSGLNEEDWPSVRDFGIAYEKARARLSPEEPRNG